MGDLAEWNLHGPVDTIRTEFAEWDRDKQDWQPVLRGWSARFRADGRELETEFRQDGSVSRSTFIYDDAGRLLEMLCEGDDKSVARHVYSYDALGRPVSTVIVDNAGRRHDFETYHYDSSGRKTRLLSRPKLEGNVSGDIETVSLSDGDTSTTYFDDHDHPTEVLVYDVDQNLKNHRIYTRDSTGRLVKEEVRLGDGAFSRYSPLSEAIRAENWMSTTYTYDEKDRTASTRRVTLFNEEHSTFRFDEHDNAIEQITDKTSRTLQADKQGRLQVVSESTCRVHTRFDRKYDAQGNWIECVTWYRAEPNPDFLRASIDRRQITYRPTTQP